MKLWKRSLHDRQLPPSLLLTCSLLPTYLPPTPSFGTPDASKKRDDGKHVPPDYKKKEMKKPPQYRDIVFLVLVDKNVLRLARERNDDYGRAITVRLAAVHDLLAADAQYHFLCMKDLNILRRKRNPPTGCVTVLVTALIKKSSLMRTTVRTTFWRYHFHLIILKKLKWIRPQIRANPVTIAQNCPRDHPVYNDGRRNYR
ncbi:hypothetical protein JTB14_026064 [Gonioctena quinquepunctata]|nr:hypothetical protein JTB14_026064 [Gonioctena quinquepunctata]